MSSAKREGAVLYPAEKRVRLRHEPTGFLYQLHEAEDGAFDVVHLDTLTGAASPVGKIRRKGERYEIEKTGHAKLDDALRLVARAWSRLPYLKKSDP